MIYKVGLLGASGRMGQQLGSLLAESFTVGRDVFELADGITREGRIVTLEGVSLRTMDEPPREPVHVWIDFSRPEATMALLDKTDCPVVIGTTGFSSAQVERIEAYARKVPVLLCANTSVGMKVVGEMLQATGALKPLGFQTTLEDDHHRYKKDAPSGTAKRLLEALAALGFSEPQVSVVRAGDTVGTHTIRWIGDGEEVLLQHRVTDRSIFAKGALYGAQFLLRQKAPRIYRFEEVTLEQK